MKTSRTKLRSINGSKRKKKLMVNNKEKQLHIIARDTNECIGILINYDVYFASSSSWGPDMNVPR
jgi:hypothetical protein